VPGQFGEEAIINKVFPRRFTGTAIEVGAADGLFMSPTKELEDRGWTVLCIEANPLFADALAKNRKLVRLVAAGKKDLDDQDFTVIEMTEAQRNWSAVSSLKVDEEQLENHKTLVRNTSTVKVPVRTLETCIREAGLTRVDFVSIDVEGTDMDVLSGFDVARWKPKLLIIENWRDDDRFEKYLKPFGYGARTRLGVNDVFTLNP
jgi:FkbM family methyltransferase